MNNDQDRLENLCVNLLEIIEREVDRIKISVKADEIDSNATRLKMIKDATETFKMVALIVTMIDE